MIAENRVEELPFLFKTVVCKIVVVNKIADYENDAYDRPFKAQTTRYDERVL